MTQSDSQLVAVPSAADTWTDLPAFTVPAGVKRLTKIRVTTVPDWGTSEISVRGAPVFRLTGSGLLEQNPHEFLGVFFGVAMKTTGGISHSRLIAEYAIDAKVQTGGQIVAQVNTLDEAITAGTSSVNLFYDELEVTSKNSQSQYVDAAGTTTADSWVAVGTFTLPNPGAENRPTKITRICLGVALDQGVNAISLRTASRFRLTGSGIAEGGNHIYEGPKCYSGEVGSTPSQGTNQNDGTVWIDVEVPINAGGQILAEHFFDNETPTASTVAVGLVYR